MTLATFTLVLSLAQPGAAETLTVAAPDLAVIDIPVVKATFYTERVANRMSEAGVRVTTSKAIAQLLTVERQRQLLGCSGESSCLAEIANALGAAGVLLGEIARIDDGYQVNLKIISARDGQTAATWIGRASSEGALLDVLDSAARVIAVEAAKSLGRILSPAPRAPLPLRPIGVAAGLVGVAAVVTGAALLGQARSLAAAIPEPGGGASPVRFEDAQRAAANGATFQIAGWSCVAAGAALVAVGVALWVAGGAPRPAVAFIVTPNGAAVSAGVSF